MKTVALLPGGPIAVRICDSKHHTTPELATKLLHWVTGPVDYCVSCAAAMHTVALALGTHVHEEDIPIPKELRGNLGTVPRAIDLGGFK